QVAESGATAVFAFDDLMAAGVIAGLSELGVRVPADRSIVGCDDVLLAQTMTPGLTTVAAPFTELGRASVEMLSEILAGRGSRTVTLPGTAALRGRVGPVAASCRSRCEPGGGGGPGGGDPGGGAERPAASLTEGSAASWSYSGGVSGGRAAALRPT